MDFCYNRTHCLEYRLSALFLNCMYFTVYILAVLVSVIFFAQPPHRRYASRRLIIIICTAGNMQSFLPESSFANTQKNVAEIFAETPV